MIATRCAAVRNCCAAFSYELRGRAAAQLRGNIALKRFNKQQVTQRSSIIHTDSYCRFVKPNWGHKANNWGCIAPPAPVVELPLGIMY